MIYTLSGSTAWAIKVVDFYTKVSGSIPGSGCTDLHTVQVAFRGYSSDLPSLTPLIVRSWLWAPINWASHTASSS